MDRQQEFVLRTLEERDIRFVRLWFTDVLGTLKSVSVAPAELESAFEEGIGFDGSAIEGFARVYESDMIAMPDPTTFQVFPFEGGVSGESARMFCDILLPGRLRLLGRPAPRAAPGLSRAAEKGFTFYTHPEIEFFLLQDVSDNGDVPTPVDSGGYFDHTTHAVARDFRRQAVLALERIGISVEFSHHEVAPGPAGDRPALRRRAHDRRQHHDLPARGQGGRAVAQRARDLHAQAVHRPAGQRHAHPPVAVRGGAQRVPRRERPDEAVQGGAGVHRRPAHPRPRVRRGHQPVGQLVQAAVPAGPARPDHRGAGVRVLGSPQPVRPGPGPRLRQAELGPGRGALARQRLQPVPGLRGPARRRPQGHRGGVRAAGRAPRTTCGRCRPPSDGPWGTRRCRRTCPRRST